MRSTYSGIKYYSPNDLSLSYYYNNAVSLLEAFDDSKQWTDVNKLLEMYNVYKLITSEGIKPEYKESYFEKAKAIMASIARYFKELNYNTLLENYQETCIDYIDDFWELVDKFKVYDNISESVFEKILNDPDTALFHILEHKGIVRHFDETIASFMRKSEQSARLIVGKYLERETSNKEIRCFLPKSLKPEELESILDRYIDSDNYNVGVLQLIATSQSSAECPISDSLRLKARRKATEYWKAHDGEGYQLSYGIGVCFKNNPDVISCEMVKPFEFQITYDLK